MSVKLQVVLYLQIRYIGQQLRLIVYVTIETFYCSECRPIVKFESRETPSKISSQTGSIADDFVSYADVSQLRIAPEIVRNIIESSAVCYHIQSSFVAMPNITFYNICMSFSERRLVDSGDIIRARIYKLEVKKRAQLLVFLRKESIGSFYYDLKGRQRLFSIEALPNLDSRANISVLRTSFNIETTSILQIVATRVGEKRQLKKRIEEPLSLPKLQCFVEIIVRHNISVPRESNSRNKKDKQGKRKVSGSQVRLADTSYIASA